MEKLSVRFGFYKVHCGSGEDFMQLEIEEENSGLRLLQVRLTMEDFAKVATGGSIKTQIELNRDAAVGQYREVKHVRVETTNLKYNATKEELERAVAPHEVDGWECNNLSDLTNPHRFAGYDDSDKEKKFHSVGFVRWVKDKPVESVENKTVVKPVVKKTKRAAK